AARRRPRRRRAAGRATGGAHRTRPSVISGHGESTSSRPPSRGAQTGAARAWILHDLIRTGRDRLPGERVPWGWCRRDRQATLAGRGGGANGLLDDAILAGVVRDRDPDASLLECLGQKRDQRTQLLVLLVDPAPQGLEHLGQAARVGPASRLLRH